jgi:hypothetical protein
MMKEINATVTVQEIEAQEKTFWAKAQRKLIFDLSKVLAGLFLLTFLLAAIRGWVVTGNLWTGIVWLFSAPDNLTGEIGNFALALTPLLAVSTAIERLFESIFAYLEKGMGNLVELIKSGKETLGWVGTTYKQALDVYNETIQQAQNNPTSIALQNVADAKAALDLAEKQVNQFMDSDEYKSWKRFICILGAFIIGIIVAIWVDLGLLRTIGVSAPRFFDMLLTGLIIGAGPGPVHSLIGILQSGKDALDTFKKDSQGEDVLKAIKELQAKVEAKE